MNSFSSLKIAAGEVAYPDFTNPDAEKWWSEMAQDFHGIIPFDGVCLVCIILYTVTFIDHDLLT